MYHKLNYIVYRRIIGYYSGERDEDAFGIFVLVENKIIKFCFRYEESSITRRREKILNTNSTSCTA
jgi:hypothetical protein